MLKTETSRPANRQRIRQVRGRIGLRLGAYLMGMVLMPELGAAQSDDYQLRSASEDLLAVLAKEGVDNPEFIVTITPDGMVSAFTTKEVEISDFSLASDRLILPLKVVEGQPVLSTEFDTAVVITHESPANLVICKKKNGQNDCDSAQ